MFLFKNPHEINAFCSVSSANVWSCASASIQIEEITKTQLPCPDQGKRIYSVFPLSSPTCIIMVNMKNHSWSHCVSCCPKRNKACLFL